MTSSKSSGWPPVVAGGLVAGACDIAYACIFWAIKAGVAPRRILQSVAAGVLGREAAVQGGNATAALGLLLHFCIALTMAAVYFLVARHWSLLWRRAWVLGAIYGLWLYIAMQYIVVPLSRAGGGGSNPDSGRVTLSVLVHVFLVGIPCAVGARYGILREGGAAR